MYYACCKILGVKPGSDISLIKSAYRKAAKELHPDINHFENASEYFNILQNAYQYLLKHPFHPVENKFIKNSTQNKNTIKSGKKGYSNIKTKSGSLAQKTLQEVLACSFTARLLYIFFHLLFLSLGIFMIISSVYDTFHYSVDPRVSIGSAYITTAFGLIFGILITVIFIVSSFNFISRR
jgi:hypothetical protein